MTRGKTAKAKQKRTVKLHRVKKKYTRSRETLSKNGRAMRLNSVRNVKLFGVGTALRTVDNSQKVVNDIKNAKKKDKREAYRAEKKAMRKAKYAQKGTDDAAMKDDDEAGKGIKPSAILRKKKVSTAIRKFVQEQKTKQEDVEMS